MITHIVLYTPKSTLTAVERRTFAESVVAILRSMPSIARAVIGRRADIDAGYPRDFGDGNYEFVAVLEFPNRAALVEYLQHPTHADLGRVFWEFSERTIVSEMECVDVREASAAAVVLGNLTSPEVGLGGPGAPEIGQENNEAPPQTAE